MSERLADEAAREAIRLDLEPNMLVEASAGSGKTECLARRMAEGLVEGRYTVDTMGAVTFTRKAASELRARLRDTLERCLLGERDPQRRARAEEALAQSGRMFAGTIHALCARLIRERPVECGITPGFEELEEHQDAELAQMAWHRFRAEAASPRVLAALEDLGIPDEALREAFGKVCQYPEVGFPEGDVSLPPEPVWDEVERFCQDLQSLMPRTPNPHSQCPVQLSLARLARVLAGSRLPRQLPRVLADWESESSTALKVREWPRAHVDAARSLVSSFRTGVALPYLRHHRAHAYRLLVPLVLEAREYYAEYRRRLGYLNYGDMLLRSAQLLRDDPTARAELQQRLQWLFVDEFQDTDPLQAEVLVWLASAPCAPGPWSQAPLRPGALFIVGDPKQSIYRFRRADMDTYLQVRRRIEESGGRVLRLTTSFRAAPELCQWVNSVFQELLPPEPSPHQAAHALLNPRPEASPGGVFTLTSGDPLYKDVPASEAQRIARFIAASVRQGGRRWSSFLILTALKRNLGEYRQALLAEGIPVDSSGEAELEKSLPVQALLDLLAYLGDPEDEIAGVAVLRGLLFGASDEDLYLYRAAGGSFRLSDPPVEDGPVSRAMQHLRGLHRLLLSLPISQALERVVEESRLLALEGYLGSNPGLLLEAAGSVERLCLAGCGLPDAVLQIRNSGSALVKAVSLECGRSEVVRVLNLHQAKGLEADVVFLADPLRGSDRAPDLRIDRQTSCGYFTLSAWWKTVAAPFDWDTHEQEESVYLNSERTRLLYVAATRARERLVVSRWTGTHRKPVRPWAVFEPWLGQVSELEELVGEARVAVADQEDYREWRGLREEREASLSRPSWERATVARHNFRGPVTTVEVADPGDWSADGGREFGLLVHRLLEHAMRGTARTSGDLERLARWFAFEDPEVARLVPAALAAVSQVMGSPFWESAMKSGRRLAEVPFALPGEGRVTFGTLDLALELEGGWGIVDYKTDALRMSQLVERYVGQLVEYARDWEGVVGEKVVHASIYGVREGDLRDVVG